METELIQYPRELLILITSFLTVTAANNLSETCSYLFQVTNDHRVWIARATEELESLFGFDAEIIAKLLDDVMLLDKAMSLKEKRFKSDPLKKIIVDPAPFIMKDRKWMPIHKTTDEAVLSSWRGPTEHRISVVGKTDSGKTAAIVRLLNNNYTYDGDGDYMRETIQDTYMKRLAFGSSQIIHSLGLDDNGGNPVFDQLLVQSIIDASSFIIVFSITDMDSFTYATSIINRIDQIKEVYRREQFDDIRKIPIVLISAKNDLEEQRQVSRLDALQLAIKLDVPLFEIRSAVDSDNIEDAFRQAVLEIMHKAHQYLPRD